MASPPPLIRSGRALIACKVCSRPSPWLGEVDFGRWCTLEWDQSEATGLLVDYHRCGYCGLLFSPCFDRFSRADWATHVYNEGYSRVDPDYNGGRAKMMADGIVGLFPAASGASLIDYGCGLGLMAEELRRLGWSDVENFDPFVPKFANRPQRRADIVFASEVLEHAPRPAETFADMATLCAQPGVMIATTLLQPDVTMADLLDWWYIAPRNGHVSIHSNDSLGLLARRQGLCMASAGRNLHIFWKDAPAWAKSVLPVTP